MKHFTSIEQSKKLLLNDLSARLPYHPRVKIWLKDGTTEEGFYDLQHNFKDVMADFFYLNKIKDLKPYLRPMLSMTEEEKNEYRHLINQYSAANPESALFLVDWLNVHHFDYRGLIEKGLALEALKGMYN